MINSSGSAQGLYNRAGAESKPADTGMNMGRALYDEQLAARSRYAEPSIPKNESEELMGEPSWYNKFTAPPVKYSVPTAQKERMVARNAIREAAKDTGQMRPDPISGDGCAFIFTDAAREAGTGYGGFTIVQEAGCQSPLFLYMAERWDDVALRQLQQNVLSMPAGECFGAVVMADAVARRLAGLTHLWCFTDSVASKAALTSECSSAPQLDSLVTWLGQSQPAVQYLAVHVPGVCNVTADKLSRGRELEVLAEVEAAGLRSERLLPVASSKALLRRVAALEHRHVG